MNTESQMNEIFRRTDELRRLHDDLRRSSKAADNLVGRDSTRRELKRQDEDDRRDDGLYNRGNRLLEDTRKPLAILPDSGSPVLRLKHREALGNNMLSIHWQGRVQSARAKSVSSSSSKTSLIEEVGPLKRGHLGRRSNSLSRVSPTQAEKRAELQRGYTFDGPVNGQSVMSSNTTVVPNERLVRRGRRRASDVVAELRGSGGRSSAPAIFPPDRDPEEDRWNRLRDGLDRVFKM